jgi:hypothetical protein
VVELTKIDFSDETSSKAWFEAQTVEVRCALASRAALRVLGALHYEALEFFEDAALPIMRAIITTTVRAQGSLSIANWEHFGSTAGIAVMPFSKPFFEALQKTVDRHKEPDGKETVVTIDSASSGVSAGFIATVAQLSAFSTYQSGSTFHALATMAATAENFAEIMYASFLFEDAHYLSGTDAPRNLKPHLPLWNSRDLPERAQIAHEGFSARLAADEKFSFWQSWYNGMWEGTFDDWELALEVVKIEDTIWDHGVDAVATEIDKIKAELLFKNSPQVEDIFETSDGLYDVRSTIQNPSDLIGSVLSRVEFAFSLAIKSNHCDLSAMSVAAQALRHALENCGDDPNGLEQYLRTASSLIKQGIADGKFAIGEELDLLTSVLDETSLQLRADHPEVGEAVNTRLTQRLKEIGDDKRLQVAEQMDAMQDGTGPRLKLEYGLDAQITRDGSDMKATAEAMQRGGNRAQKISLAERAKKAEGSGGMSALKIGLRAKRLVEFICPSLGEGKANLAAPLLRELP